MGGGGRNGTEVHSGQCSFEWVTKELNKKKDKGVVTKRRIIKKVSQHNLARKKNMRKNQSAVSKVRVFKKHPLNLMFEG